MQSLIIVGNLSAVGCVLRGAFVLLFRIVSEESPGQKSEIGTAASG